MAQSYDWLGYAWGRCNSCRSVQKLIDLAGYESLSPTYDPGTIVQPSASSTDIEAALGVPKKLAQLRPYRNAAPQRFLDIGCGAGGYLLAARRLGFEVVGVEPSAAHSSIARERFGLPVVTGYFEPDQFTDPFDVVMLSHVIEHIYDPKAFLTKIARVLSPGGVLIAVTPNVESLTAAITGKYWSMFKPVDHVTMLGPHSIAHCIPNNCRLVGTRTHEWPGEFAAHMISAIKQRARPQIGNVAHQGTAKVSARQETLSPAVKAVLAALSLPFFIAGRGLDRKSCLTAVIARR